LLVTVLLEGSYILDIPCKIYKVEESDFPLKNHLQRDVVSLSRVDRGKNVTVIVWDLHSSHGHC